MRLSQTFRRFSTRTGVVCRIGTGAEPGRSQTARAAWVGEMINFTSKGGAHPDLNVPALVAACSPCPTLLTEW